MSGSPERTRLWQVVLLALLGVCVAQTLYWIFDQVNVTNRERNERLVYYAADARAANLLHDAGIAPEEILRLFPHLDGPLADDSGALVVSPTVLANLDQVRHSRIRRLGWEGTFFLLVLLGGMAILARALARSAELRRRQQNFLAAVTHEFKSPIASLRLSLETLELRDPEKPRRAELLGRALQDIDRLEAMATNILDTARIEEARATHSPERVNLDDVVAAEVDRLERRAVEREVALRFEGGVGLAILADAEAVRSVVHNLLDNAMKACGEGGTVRASTRAANGAVALEVQDDGVGFPPTEAQRIFEKFHRVGDELRRRDRGSGLGLYLVRRLVDRDRGHVLARSDGHGRGATFTVAWPRAPEEA